ncbi:mevalonate kinase [Ditylenchus destructor]|uniref:Mevalonate kinase n=1 Tax=Ditylenchus destructor TaxID=166010 RepID=A0AAD4RE00_9BILA|nr:mevalonate kinase [Ditylenchus destructor]
MVAPGNSRNNGPAVAEDSPSASSSSSHAHTLTNNTATSVTPTVNHVGPGSSATLTNNYHLSGLAGTATSGSGSCSPMRSLSSAHGGLYISAPGKIILFGEHAVVYGRTAIAGAIDLRTYVSLFTSADGRIYLSLPDLEVEKTWLLKDLQKAAERLAAENPLLDDGPPSLELIVPIARKLSGACEDQCGVQHLAILAFWYLLIGVVQRKRSMELAEQQGQDQPQQNYLDPGFGSSGSPPASPTGSSKSWPGSNSSSSVCAMQDPRTKLAAWDLLAVKLTVRFKLPPCVGLGSSGAFCVCVATALLQTAGLIPPPSVSSDDDGQFTWEEPHLEMIRKWSAAAESLIHGRASGLDAAVCTYGSKPRARYGYQSFTHLAHVSSFGGVASYKPGKRIENLQNVPHLKVILVNSKVERNTSRMVQSVRDKLNKFPKIVEAIFDSIDAISIEAARIIQRPLNNTILDENGSAVLENGGRSATLTPSFGAASLGGGAGEPGDHHHNLQPVSAGGRSSSLSSYVAGGKRGSTTSAVSGTSGDYRNKAEKNEMTDTFERLNDLSRINNQLLISLGVGHAKVDQICTLLGRYGIHPKMTGAGGGGSVFAFLKPDISQTILNMIRDELKKEGYDMWQPSLGGPGVLCHTHKPDLFNSITAATSTAGSTVSGAGSTAGSTSTRSNTPASSHHSTPAIRHKK